jgi:hypothetical protein
MSNNGNFEKCCDIFHTVNLTKLSECAYICRDCKLIHAEFVNYYKEMESK